MPIGLVAGTAGAVITTRAVQLFNAIPQTARNQWRIFYYNNNQHGFDEYTRVNFNNQHNVDIAQENHCVIFCHGFYINQGNNVFRSNELSAWDIDANHAEQNTQVYIDWLQAEGVNINTVKIAACHAGNIGNPNNHITPIQRIVNLENRNIQADGPTTALLALNGVNLAWTPNVEAGWQRFPIE